MMIYFFVVYFVNACGFFCQRLLKMLRNERCFHWAFCNQLLCICHDRNHWFCKMKYQYLDIVSENR